MAEAEEKEEKTKRRFRLRPRLPRIRSGNLRTSDQFRKLKADVSTPRHLCPHDDSPMELTDVYPTGPDGQIPDGATTERALVCPTCSFTVPATAVIDKLKADAAPIKKAEKQFTVFGFVILVSFGIISLINGNILTIIGALVMSLTLFIKALFFRYRYWQASTGQMFLDEAPVARWLKDEFAKK